VGIPVVIKDKEPNTPSIVFPPEKKKEEKIMAFSSRLLSRSKQVTTFLLSISDLLILVSIHPFISYRRISILFVFPQNRGNDESINSDVFFYIMFGL
jgi:hypothetical protein